MSPEEFTDFYAGSFRRLVGQLYVMTGDRAEAQDAVQEAFVRAWARREKLDRHGAPEAWVRAAAWHIAVSRWHRARLGGLLMRSHPQPEATDGPTPDRVALIEALRKVPAEQRRALVLYYLCDLTVAQIAAETGAPAGTVKARLARGRAAVAPYLRDAAGRGARPGTPQAAARRWPVPDFEDELQLVASQAAEDVQPMSAAEVMRRGASRRRRRVALDAVAALAVAGAIAGGVLSISSASSAGGRPGPQMPASRPAPAARPATGPATGPVTRPPTPRPTSSDWPPSPVGGNPAPSPSPSRTSPASLPVPAGTPSGRAPLPVSTP